MTFLIDELWRLDFNSWSDSELKDLFITIVTTNPHSVEVMFVYLALNRVRLELR